MNAQPTHAEPAFAQPLTEALLAHASITPGMRVLTLSPDPVDLAFLVAERVGRDGTVIGMHPNPRVVEHARERAKAESFDRVEFRLGTLQAPPLDFSPDAVVGRFFLMCERNPAHALSLAADLIHDGGRVVFHEWHYDSVLWEHTSAWPNVAMYRRYARWSIDAMRRAGMHVDIGLRLPNLFTEAGLPLPEIRSDLRTVQGAGSRGYAFFESAIRATIETLGGRSAGFPMDGFAERLERETLAAAGHLFLPLQVGAWSRKRRV